MPQFDAANGGGTEDESDDDGGNGVDDSPDPTTTPTPIHPEPGVDEPEPEEESEPPEPSPEPEPEPEPEEQEEEQPEADAADEDDLLDPTVAAEAGTEEHQLQQQAQDFAEETLEDRGIDPADFEGLGTHDIVTVQEDNGELQLEFTDRGRRRLAEREIAEEEGVDEDEIEVEETEDGFVARWTDARDERLDREAEELGGPGADVVDPTEIEEGIPDAAFADFGDAAEPTGPGGEEVPDATIDVAPRPPTDEAIEEAEAEAADRQQAVEGITAAPVPDTPAVEIREDIAAERDDIEPEDVQLDVRDGELVAQIEVEDEFLDLSVPVTEREEARMVRDVARFGVGIAAAPAIAAGAEIQERVDVETEDVAALGAIGLATPEPGTTAVGGAVLAGIGAAAAVREVDEINVPTERETTEITVPVTPEGTDAEIAVPEQPTETGEITVPEESGAVQEISVPQEQVREDPEIMRAAPELVGVQQQVEQEFDDENVVEDGTIIIDEENLEDTGPLVDIPADQQQQQIREELERRQEFARGDTETEFEPAREDLPGRIDSPAVEGDIGADETAMQQEVTAPSVRAVSTPTLQPPTGTIPPAATVGVSPVLMDVTAPETDVDSSTDITPTTDVTSGLDVTTDVATDLMTDVAVTPMMADQALEVAEPAAFDFPAEFGFPTEVATPTQVTETGVPRAPQTPRIDLDFGDPGPDRQRRRFAEDVVEFEFDLDIDPVTGGEL